MSSPYELEVLADSPQLYWMLHDGSGAPTPDVTVATDSSGNGNHGLYKTPTSGFPSLLGQQGLVSGDSSSLYFPPVAYGHYARIEDFGTLSDNIAVEVVVKVASDNNYRLVVNGGPFACTIGVDEGPSHNDGMYMELVELNEAHEGGLRSLDVDIDPLDEGERYHLLWQFTGVIGTTSILDPDMTRFSFYINGDLVGDEMDAVTDDLDLRDETSWMEFAGFGFYVEHLAIYGHGLDATRRAAHLDAMGQVYWTGQSVETDTGRMIGYPRTQGFLQAGFPDTFQLDVDRTPPLGETFSLHREVATLLRPNGTSVGVDETFNLGQAVETAVARPVTRLGVGTIVSTDPVPAVNRAFPPRRLAAR